MMNKRHRRADILQAAVDAAVADGLHQLSFGRIAARLGIADRTVVYYFSTKEQLVSEVIGAVGAEFIALLDDAFGDAQRPTEELLRRAWPVLTTPAADQTFKLFFELVGLASAQMEPYVSLAPLAMEGWVSLITPRVLPDGGTSRSAALVLIAQVDGLLMLRHTLGPEAALEAAQQIDPSLG
jgi:AcrR family transcriptional regulator